MADPTEIAKLKATLKYKVPVGILAVLGLLLGTAGSWYFWQAWVLVVSLSLVLVAIARYYLKNDPDFLVHRMTYRERDTSQTKLIPLSQIYFFGLFLISGLDFRFGWSHLDPSICIAAFIVFYVAYAFILWVFQTNRFASRIVEVQKNQKVIDYGPYRFVRHPMYTGVIIMYPTLLLALGSWWAALGGMGLIIIIVLRIRGEEALLNKELPGYTDYCKKTPYRLIPYLW